MTRSAGDLAKSRFGLDPQLWTHLAETADLILHNGALVNHAFTYEQLFEPNVLGTLEVRDNFAQLCLRMYLRLSIRAHHNSAFSQRSRSCMIGCSMAGASIDICGRRQCVKTLWLELMQTVLCDQDRLHQLL